MKNENKNRDFVQLYRNNINNVANVACENRQAFRFLMFLIEHMDGTNSLCVSTTAIAEILNCSKATVGRSIKYLRENGWVCVLKTGTSNVYIVNPDVAWTSYGNQKKYCKFQSTVLLSSTENAEYLKNRKASMRFKTIDSSFIKSAKEKQEQFKNEAKRINQA